AGQPQVAYYVWLATGIWALAATGAAMLRARHSDAAARGDAGGTAVGKELARGVGTAAGAFVFGLGLASVQILGTLEYDGLLARTDAGAACGTPLLHLRFLHIPLLSRFGGINHMVLLLDSGLACLAALGLVALMTRTARPARPEAPLKAPGVIALGGCAVL